VPGPACYGRGGDRATVTDADAVLGYLPPDGFAGGRMRLDVEAARRAITRDVAEPLGLDPVEAAWGVERIVNANMANATRKVLSGYGADPRALAMIAFGGNGAVHAWAIARELGIGRVLIPRTAPGFSALGLLVADYRVDLIKTYVVPLAQVDIDRLGRLVADVDDEVTKELEPTGLGAIQVDRQRFVQMSYAGQNFDMSVPLPTGHELDGSALMDLAERFHDQHERDRGFSFRQQGPVVRGVRVIATGRTDKPDHLGELGSVTDAAQARTGARPVFFDHGFVDTPTYDGASLGAGATVEGPALIEEPFTVVVVPPGFRATLADHASYELTASA
jgi:N-methylhydantoinase A